MTPYFFRKYHAMSHAQGNTRNANMMASLTEQSLAPRATVGSTGWAE